MIVSAGAQDAESLLVAVHCPEPAALTRLNTPLAAAVHAFNPVFRGKSSVMIGSEWQ
jgi:hypothetical protein